MEVVKREHHQKKKGKRRKEKEFMDAVLDAYIRDQALHKWREVDGLVQGAQVERGQALRDAGEFPEKGPYQDLWRQWWGREVLAGEVPAEDTLFASIEAAVRGAVLDEREERKRRADPSLEDSAQYKAFVSGAMEKLLGEASGEIEEWD